MAKHVHRKDSWVCMYVYGLRTYIQMYVNVSMCREPAISPRQKRHSEHLYFSIYFYFYSIPSMSHNINQSASTNIKCDEGNELLRISDWTQGQELLVLSFILQARHTKCHPSEVFSREFVYRHQSAKWYPTYIDCLER